MKNKKIYKLLFWYSIAGLLIISSIPTDKVKEVTSNFDLSMRLDYIMHFIAYFIISFFGVVGYGANKRHLLYILLFAIAEEGHQYFIPYRTFNPFDLISDFVGIMVVYIIWLLFLRTILEKRN